MTPHTGGRYLL